MTFNTRDSDLFARYPTLMSTPKRLARLRAFAQSIDYHPGKSSFEAGEHSTDMGLSVDLLERYPYLKYEYLDCETEEADVDEAEMERFRVRASDIAMLPTALDLRQTLEIALKVMDAPEMYMDLYAEFEAHEEEIHQLLVTLQAHENDADALALDIEQALKTFVHETEPEVVELEAMFQRVSATIVSVRIMRRDVRELLAATHVALSRGRSWVQSADISPCLYMPVMYHSSTDMNLHIYIGVYSGQCY
ncbi:hypothetical protein FA95DRAFT_1557821 [Auriscalpium vulgare]|uniref:Uncharacterized protein n=1 Tax=Auriscalpium vulgare TaxID=40419 RepID=A0ACB8RXN2_9AGAM|nr:hypothetical protein FA95DRAFT_1557821 [Auriscalpium vulgare]